MKRLRLILLVFWTLSFLIFLSFFIVNRWILPLKVKPFLLQQLETKMGLLPEARSFSYHPLKGFILSDLRLFDPEEREEPILEAKLLSFRPLWLALLFKQQVILSDLSLEGPRWTLRRDGEGRWNVEKFFEKKGEAAGALLISRITLKDGTIEVIDEKLDPAYRLTLTSLQLNLSFALPDRLRIKGRSRLLDVPTEVFIDGIYSFSQREFSLEVELKQLTERLIQPYLASLPFSVTEGKGDLRCHISLDRNQTLSLQKIHYQGSLGLRQEGWQSSGQVVLDGFLTLWPKEPPDRDYFFTLLLKEGRFESQGLPAAMEMLEGKLTLKEETLTLEAMKGRWAGQSFAAQGLLQNFQEPSLDGLVEATLDLLSLQMLPTSAPLLKYGRILSGKGAVRLTLRGPLGKEVPLDYLAEGRLEDVSLKLDLLPQTIEAVSGTFHLSPGQFLLQEVEGYYEKDPFRLKAEVNDFRHPQLAMNLAWKGQELETQFRVDGEDFHPFRASLHRGPTALSFEGAVIHYQDPSLDGTLNVRGPLQDLTSFFPKSKAQLERLKLEGELDGQFEVKGPLRQPDALFLQGTAILPRLSLKELFFKNVEARLRYAERTVVVSDLVCQAYGGSLAGKFSWGLAEPFPFMIQTELRGVQLDRLLPTVSHRLRKMEGRLDGRLLLDGQAADPQTIVGEGALEIREGNLYQVPILKGLFGAWGPVIGLLYPELDEWVTLREATAQLTIANRAVRTEDLRVIGDRLTLYADGQIGFDQTLDFDVWLRFTDPTIIERSSNLSKLKNVLIDETGMLGGKVLVKGTLSEPKFRYTSLPLNQLREFFKGAADFILPKILGEE